MPGFIAHSIRDASSLEIHSPAKSPALGQWKWELSTASPPERSAAVSLLPLTAAGILATSSDVHGLDQLNHTTGATTAPTTVGMSTERGTRRGCWGAMPRTRVVDNGVDTRAQRP